MLDREIVSYPENMWTSCRKEITLPVTATPVDIESNSQERYPIIIVPLHVQEPRKIGNLRFVIIDSSYHNQTATLRFTDARNKDSSKEFNLNDLIKEDETLFIGSQGRLACRKVRPSGFVILAVTVPQRIIVHS